jgi:hypothetical protein
VQPLHPQIELAWCLLSLAHLPALKVMDLVELTPLRNTLVGLPGASGLSVEQRKRLTIAVELVLPPNPSPYDVVCTVLSQQSGPDREFVMVLAAHSRPTAAHM